MGRRNTSVFGTYHDSHAVEQGVGTLIIKGFSSGNISVLVPESIDREPSGGPAEGAEERQEAAGTLGRLNDVGSLAIPGHGRFLAAGPLMGAIADSGSGSSVPRVTGALVAMGIPSYEAPRYERVVDQGNAVVSVHCEDLLSVAGAKEVLRRTGAAVISSSAETDVDPDQKFESPRMRHRS